MISIDHCRINYAIVLKELKNIEQDYLPLLPDKLKEQYRNLLLAQEQLKQDKVFNAAARLIRFLHPRYEKLLKDLDTGAKNSTTFKNDLNIKKIFKSSPLIIASKKSGTVYVFPNLILDSTNSSDLKYTCWAIFSDVLKTFNEIKYKKPNSWQPFFRAWRKIKVYEEMSISRALLRYTNIKSEYSHEQIIILSEAYTEVTKPLELLFADKPVDYIKMFSSGGVNTCMTTNLSKKETWHELLKHDHHPMSLFAYYPGVRGVYCTKGDKVVARTLIYGAKYGYIYAINGGYRAKFENMLKENNYKEAKDKLNKKITIKVPGLYSKHFKGYILPVPYMDNVSSNLYGEFDDNEKQFVLTFGGLLKNNNISTASTGGFIKASSLKRVRCSNCNSMRLPGAYINTWNSKEYFCNYDCANEFGYVSATTSDGSTQLRLRDTCYQDFLIRGTFYTNRHSCVIHGGRPVISSVIINEKENKITSVIVEPKEFSRFGNCVIYNGVKHVVSSAIWGTMKRANVFNRNFELKCELGDLL